MRGRFAVVLVFLLSTFVYTDPAWAQRTSGRDRPGRGAGDELAEVVRSVERDQRARARHWASTRGLPTRILQRDGRAVELVDVVEGRPVYVTSSNRYAGQALGTAHLYTDGRQGLGLTGQGMTIGIWDGGRVRAQHQELRGRVRSGDNASTTDLHATHVGGTLVASGVRPEARGMAYEAELVSYDWSNDGDELFNEGRTNGLLVSNHSYGPIGGWYYGDLEDTGQDRWYWAGDPRVSEREDYGFGWYDTDAAQFDRVVYANPYLLPVIAAGNERTDRAPLTGSYRGLDASGGWQTYDVATHPRPDDGDYDTLIGASVAKNVLTVGSVRVFNNGVSQISDYSSFGPTDDGRIKPDVVSHGEQVFSTFNDSDTAYGYSSGTSMAAPTVAGSLLLLQQHHHTLTGDYLTAAALKGLVLHTAADLALPGPDYRTGWGLMNAEAAALHLSDAVAQALALGEHEIVNGESVVVTGTALEAGPLRVTLAWTDVPSTRRPVNGSSSLDDPRPHLIDDLDLRLVHEETGEVFRPYVLDPNHPAEAALPGDNVVDPIEQIYLPHAEPGTYAIHISHKGTLSEDAVPFALLTTGLGTTVRPTAVGHLEAAAEANAVGLSWRTNFERSTGRFVIERAPVTYRGSARTVGTFEEAGALHAQGPSEAEQAYTWRDERLLAGRYLYRLLYDDGDVRFVTSEVEVNLPPPSDFAFVSNYPNPFAGRTTLVVDLPEPQQARVEVYDVTGRRLVVLHDGTLAAGRHELVLDATGWPPGVYFARVRASSGLRVHQLIVAR